MFSSGKGHDTIWDKMLSPGMVVLSSGTVCYHSGWDGNVMFWGWLFSSDVLCIDFISCYHLIYFHVILSAEMIYKFPLPFSFILKMSRTPGFQKLKCKRKLLVRNCFSSNSTFSLNCFPPTNVYYNCTIIYVYTSMYIFLKCGCTLYTLYCKSVLWSIMSCIIIKD